MLIFGQTCLIRLQLVDSSVSSSRLASVIAQELPLGICAEIPSEITFERMTRIISEISVKICAYTFQRFIEDIFSKYEFINSPEELQKLDQNLVQIPHGSYVNTLTYFFFNYIVKDFYSGFFPEIFLGIVPRPPSVNFLEI